ncbi:class I SAM-dependent methyltransferase [Almyronema epifaneia]|uniref:Class I SAM-dependent methyltransferase n=1 Tax=Almyronema epifaneia S1 TaxID=2991925 RepID=A0ABW6IFZ1_9CYAN
MGFYSRVIFPRLLDWSMSGEAFAMHRQALLKEVTGNVLEIGFGTGLNLAYYPDAVQQLTIVDPNPGVNAIAQKRIQASSKQVQSYRVSGESLPMADETFDSVVSTWTLCSIPQVDQALAEVARVLKPGGRFFFVEHGLSPEGGVQAWQNRLTPVQKVIADGCHLNRPIQALVEQHLKILKLDTFYEPGFPKVASYFYQGVAEKP